MCEVDTVIFLFCYIGSMASRQVKEVRTYQRWPSDLDRPVWFPLSAVSIPWWPRPPSCSTQLSPSSVAMDATQSENSTQGNFTFRYKWPHKTGDFAAEMVMEELGVFIYNWLIHGKDWVHFSELKSLKISFSTRAQIAFSASVFEYKSNSKTWFQLVSNTTFHDLKERSHVTIFSQIFFYF